MGLEFQKIFYQSLQYSIQSLVLDVHDRGYDRQQKSSTECVPWIESNDFTITSRNPPLQCPKTAKCADQAPGQVGG